MRMKTNCWLPCLPSRTSGLWRAIRQSLTSNNSRRIQPRRCGLGSIQGKHLDDDLSIPNTRRPNNRAILARFAEPNRKLGVAQFADANLKIAKTRHLPQTVGGASSFSLETKGSQSAARKRPGEFVHIVLEM